VVSSTLNAVRIATLFQLFEPDAGSAIGLKAFEGAARIAAWQLHEAWRFYGELVLSAEQVDVEWIEETDLGHPRRGLGQMPAMTCRNSRVITFKAAQLRIPFPPPFWGPPPRSEGFRPSLDISTSLSNQTL